MHPDNIKGFEEFATTKPLFNTGDLVYVQSNFKLPKREGVINWRRWELGNQTWGYSIILNDGGRTLAVESSLSFKE